MTTIANIINMINNGDVPSFADLIHHFDGLDLWNIRNACFGDSNAAQVFCNTKGAHGMKWQIGYDNRASITMRDGQEIVAISVTPAHALILAALQAIEIEKTRAGQSATATSQQPAQLVREEPEKT